MPDNVSIRCASIAQNASPHDQQQAMRRYLAICEVEALCEVLGHTRCAAVAAVAAKNRVAPGTVWRWVRWVEGAGRSPAVRLRFLLGRRPRQMRHEHRRLFSESADAR